MPEEMNHLTPMPYGKHKGTPMQDVPASYLHWLWCQESLSDFGVKEYIKANLNELKQNYPDGIW